MSTPFLQAHVRNLVHLLIQRDLLELAEGSIAEDVVTSVASYFAEHGANQSLITLTSRALLDSPAVDELYADDDDLKDAWDDTGR